LREAQQYSGCGMSWVLFPPQVKRKHWRGQCRMQTDVILFRLLRGLAHRIGIHMHAA